MEESSVRTITLKPPLDDATVSSLMIGDKVVINGAIYTARDAAHKRIFDLLDRGEKPPFDLRGQIIYYVGPTPARPGRVIGSAGPTTSIRMDTYTPRLLELGVKATIGKGYRTQAVIDAMVRHKAVYLVAIGGVGALLAKRIVGSELTAFEDLGTEAIRRLDVEEFPAVVANDVRGNDLFREGARRYSEER